MAFHRGPTIVKEQLKLYYDFGNSKSFKYYSRIYNYGIWEDGQTGAVTPFGVGSTNNRRVLGTDPWGNTIVVWESYSVSGATTYGGIYMGYLPFDNTKMYRMSWWEKRISNSTSTYCRHYAGLNSNLPVSGRTDGVATNNPYFWYTGNIPSESQLPINTWILIVGHVWPVGSGVGSMHVDSGRYTTSGYFGSIVQDYVLGNNASTLRSRTLTVYTSTTPSNTNDVLHHTAYPRLDICDGTEPSIDDLLNNRTDKSFDLSSYKTNGFLINGPTYDSNYFGSLVFDGINDYIELENTVLFTENNTLSMWINFNNVSTALYFIGDESGHGIRYNGTSFLMFDGNLDYTTVNWTKIDKIVNFVIRRVGVSTYEIYIDNVYLGTGLSNNSDVLVDINIKYIGRRSDGYYFNGYIYNILLYNKLLSINEMTQNYNALKNRFI